MGSLHDREKRRVAAGDEGGRGAALFTSILATDKSAGVEPYAQLADVLARVQRPPLPRSPNSRRAAGPPRAAESALAQLPAAAVFGGGIEWGHPDRYRTPAAPIPARPTPSSPRHAAMRRAALLQSTPATPATHAECAARASRRQAHRSLLGVQEVGGSNPLAPTNVTCDRVATYVVRSTSRPTRPIGRFRVELLYALLYRARTTQFSGASCAPVEPERAVGRRRAAHPMRSKQVC